MVMRQMNKLLVVEGKLDNLNNARITENTKAHAYITDENNITVTIDENVVFRIDMINVLKKDLKININLAHNSKLYWNQLLLNTGDNKIDVTVSLLGNNCKSFLKIRGINETKESKLNLVCDGIIKDGTIDTELIEDLKGLILNEDTIKISPNMIVNTSEVMANHFVTIGPINEEELFYLMSKGLSEELARKLIKKAFMESILSEELKNIWNKEVNSDE